MPRRRPLPALPETLPLPAGPYTVVRAPLPDEDGTGTYGRCEWLTRTITVDPALEPTAAWLTLWHEWVHAVIADAGIKGLSAAKEEALCDALAVAQLARMQAPGRVP